MKLFKLAIFAIILGSYNPVMAQELSSSSISYYESRMSELENQIKRLTGRVEREANENRRMKDSLKRTIRDMEMRISDLEKKPSGNTYSNYSAPAAAPAPTAVYTTTRRANDNVDLGDNYTSTQKTVISSLGTLTQDRNVTRLTGNPVINTSPNAMYESAFSLIRSGQHSEAERAFSNFLNKYPEDRLASNASYWKAETHYVRADYNKAAKSFAQSYQKYPKGAKAPDNLLKLGLSLAKLNKKPDACLTFKQLHKEFGNSTGNPVLRKAKEEENRLGCE